MVKLFQARIGARKALEFDPVQSTIANVFVLKQVAWRID